MVQSDPVVDLLRRELRRMSPGVRIESDEIRNAVRDDVLKRDVLEGEGADAARRQVSRAVGRMLRAERMPAAEAPPAPLEDVNELAGDSVA
jgi:hypothetical protein